MRDNNISRCFSFLETNIPHGGKEQSGRFRMKINKKGESLCVLKISGGGKSGFVVQ